MISYYLFFIALFPFLAPIECVTNTFSALQVRSINAFSGQCEEDFNILIDSAAESHAVAVFDTSLTASSTILSVTLQITSTTAIFPADMGVTLYGSASGLTTDTTDFVCIDSILSIQATKSTSIPAPGSVYSEDLTSFVESLQTEAEFEGTIYIKFIPGSSAATEQFYTNDLSGIKLIVEELDPPSK